MRALLMLLAMTTAVAAEPATKLDRAKIVGWAKTFFADPYSLRSTEISDRTEVNGITVICIQFNVKNVSGGYGGIDNMPFEVQGDRLRPGNKSTNVDTATCYQPQIRYRPFPELMAIR